MPSRGEVGVSVACFGVNFFVPWKQLHLQAGGLGPLWRPCPLLQGGQGCGQMSGTPRLRDTHRARRSPWSQLLLGPGRPARLGSSRSPDDTKSLSRATLDCSLLRVARSGEAALLDSGRAGRSSPYRFALMIFLKERDSCEQTGLTGTASPPPPPPGDFFLSAPDFKVSNRPLSAA